MTDREKLLSFEKYMRDLGYSEERIAFNVKIVKLLITRVLNFFNQNLENIDMYCFEEFTDMISLIDNELGGREGIPKMLDAMMDLTEFLKINKFIKGGKIAYYKRMFSDVDYYKDKYDMMTGKKDDTKEFIKNIMSNRFTSSLIKLVEDINVYDFKTMDMVDRILNDVPFEKGRVDENVPVLVSLLANLKLLEVKNGQMEATKKGRSISRLSAEERYAALLYLLLYSANWNLAADFKDELVFQDNFKDILYIFSTVFKDKKEVVIDIKSINDIKEDEMLIEISSDKFRIARAESIPLGNRFIDICFVGMGLLEINQDKLGKVIYRTNDFGMQFFKLVYENDASIIKSEIQSIGFMIRNRDYDNIEKNAIRFIATYGSNSVVWDYLGQVLLLKKKYTSAYNVLKYALEKCSMRSKAAKSILYHLILCCRKLKLDDDVHAYEEKLQSMEKV